MMFCKQILGVQKQTTVGVLLELGRIPLDIYANKFAIKNWERVKGEHSNDLLLSSYNDAVNENLPWISNIKTLLEGKGMLNFFINSYENKPTFIQGGSSQKIFDIKVEWVGVKACQKIHENVNKFILYIFENSVSREF